MKTSDTVSLHAGIMPSNYPLISYFSETENVRNEVTSWGNISKEGTSEMRQGAGRWDGCRLLLAWGRPR